MTTNLIIFPDWTQQEDLLYQDFANLIKKVADQNNTNLWVDITGISQEKAELMFSSVITTLIFKEGLEISDSLQLSFIGNLIQEEWQNIHRHIHQRIYLNCDRNNSVPIDNQYFCPVCENEIINFLPLPQFYLDNLSKENWNYNLDDLEMLNYHQYSCPFCSASDRDRLYALYLGTFLKSYTCDTIFRIVDFAPSIPLSNCIKKLLNFYFPQRYEYRTADLIMSNVDDMVDLTNMKIYKDNHFDFFICSHILEHIPDDNKALQELYRILKAGGKGILMVPIVLSINEIDEDPDLTDIAERWRRFGQSDHIRQYSKKGFLERIENAGFNINQISSNFFAEDIFTESGINLKSVLYVVQK